MHIRDDSFGPFITLSFNMMKRVFLIEKLSLGSTLTLALCMLVNHTKYFDGKNLFISFYSWPIIGENICISI